MPDPSEVTGAYPRECPRRLRRRREQSAAVELGQLVHWSGGL